MRDGTAPERVLVLNRCGGAGELRCGSHGAPEQSDATNVWANGYVAVWHLGEDAEETAPQFFNSMLGTNDGTSSLYREAGDFTIHTCGDSTHWIGTAISNETSNIKEGAACVVETWANVSSGTVCTFEYDPAAPMNIGDRDIMCWLRGNNWHFYNHMDQTPRVYIYDGDGKYRYHNTLAYGGSGWWKQIWGVEDGGSVGPGGAPASTNIDKLVWEFVPNKSGELKIYIDIIEANGSLSFNKTVAGKIGRAVDFNWNDRIDTTVDVSPMNHASYTWSICFRLRHIDRSYKPSTGANQYCGYSAASATTPVRFYCQKNDYRTECGDWTEDVCAQHAFVADASAPDSTAGLRTRRGSCRISLSRRVRHAPEAAPRCTAGVPA